uniref:Uncharacterized protein n=1 Tax=Rhizophora mucronata TaxID=61149 RepID=A0A2P2QUE4_RHIMU
MGKKLEQLECQHYIKILIIQNEPKQLLTSKLESYRNLGMLSPSVSTQEQKPD